MTPCPVQRTEAALTDALTRAANSIELPGETANRLRSANYRARSASLAGAGIGIAVAASAVIGGVLIAGAPETRVEHRTTTVHGQSAIRLADDVITAVNESNAIEKVHISGGGMPSSTQWISPDGHTVRIETLAADGTPLTDESTTDSGSGQTTRFVDYRARTWWTGPAAASMTVPAAAPAPLTQSEIAQMLSHGGFAKTGRHATINGTANAYEIAGKIPGPDGATALSMWIDPSTSLPIRVTLSPPNAPSTVSDASWEQPTASTRAQLTAVAPPSFIKVSPPSATG